MRIVSYYTPEYKDELQGWTESIMALGMPYFVTMVESKGTWRANCGHKPHFLLECLEQFKEPLLWIDIDGRVKGKLPELATAPSLYDFGCWFIPWDQMNRNHKPGGPKSQTDGTASGTMFVNDTDTGRAMMAAWIAHDEGQHHYEQIVLGEAFHYHRPRNLRTWRMPQRYCKVFDAKWKRGEEGPVEIEHYQASRRLKRKVR